MKPKKATMKKKITIIIMIKTPKKEKESQWK